MSENRHTNIPVVAWAFHVDGRTSRRVYVRALLLTANW